MILRHTAVTLQMDPGKKSLFRCRTQRYGAWAHGGIQIKAATTRDHMNRAVFEHSGSCDGYYGHFPYLLSDFMALEYHSFRRIAINHWLIFSFFSKNLFCQGAPFGYSGFEPRILPPRFTKPGLGIIILYWMDTKQNNSNQLQKLPVLQVKKENRKRFHASSMKNG